MRVSFPARRIGGRERYELDATETMLVGARGGGAIRIGDPVTVSVDRVEAPRGRVDLLPCRELMAKKAKEHRGRRSAGTSPPTGAPGTSSRCWRGWRPGIELQGSEVKSLRDGKAQINEAYAVIDRGEVWLRGAHIPPYLPASDQNHDPDRPRKLLLHRREIERLIGKTAERGLTLVPTRIYFKGPRAKVELALAKGKEGRDRRREIADRDMRREVERDFKQRLS